MLSGLWMVLAGCASAAPGEMGMAETYESAPSEPVESVAPEAPVAPPLGVEAFPVLEASGLPALAEMPALPPPVATAEPKTEPGAEPAPDVAPAPSLPLMVTPEPPTPVPLPVITFSVVGDDAFNARYPLPILHTSLDTAISRWSAATCREMKALPEGGQHTVTWGDKTTIASGRLGQTTGSWDAALIQSKKITMGATEIILTHELAHLFARSNDHAPDGVYGDDPFRAGGDQITEADLTKVCASLECRCFQPETAAIN